MVTSVIIRLFFGGCRVFHPITVKKIISRRPKLGLDLVSLSRLFLEENAFRFTYIASTLLVFDLTFTMGRYASHEMAFLTLGKVSLIVSPFHLYPLHWSMMSSCNFVKSRSAVPPLIASSHFCYYYRNRHGLGAKSSFQSKSQCV